jgi:hypothetical protein
LEQKKPERDRQGGDDNFKMGRIGNRPYWMLNLSLPIRAAHQLGAAVFLSAYLLNVLPGPPRLYVGIVLVSGFLLMLSEWLRHRQLFREVAGMITLVKLLLLGAAFHGYLPATATVLLAFFIASIGAHAPKKVRHRLLF